MTSAASIRRLPRNIPAAFYRGGTSRGLLFHDIDLAAFDRSTRDRIICSAMGSPDPDGRQIDGLGGGASSLSKTAIISPAGSMAALNARKNGSPLPAGLDWIDEDVQRTKQMCDIVYRFGQVPINGNTVDWSSTCGNMVAAVAHFSVQQGLISPEILADRLPPPRQSGDSGQRQSLPMSILSHDSAKVVIARVPVDLFHTDGNVFKWLPALDGEATIAGVPGRHPGILIESPLEGSVLSTGQPRDEVEVDGDQIPVSIIDTGLPVIFVTAQSLGVPLKTLAEHPAAIDSNRPFMEKLERLRFAASRLSPSLQSKFSTTAPKVCVVHPRATYESTGGSPVQAEDMDLLVRAVSVGQLHRTIPATTLSALVASLCFQASITSGLIRSQKLSQTTIKEIQQASSSSSAGDASDLLRAVTVGQPAGLSSASVQRDGNGFPKAIVMLRTARQIMQGQVLVPSDCVPHSNSL